MATKYTEKLLKQCFSVNLNPEPGTPELIRREILQVEGHDQAGAAGFEAAA
jgi:hypothetical protein